MGSTTSKAKEKREARKAARMPSRTRHNLAAAITAADLRDETFCRRKKHRYVGSPVGDFVVWLSNPETTGDIRLVGRLWGTTTTELAAAGRFLDAELAQEWIEASVHTFQVGSYLHLGNCNPRPFPVADLGQGA